MSNRVGRRNPNRGPKKAAATAAPSPPTPTTRINPLTGRPVGDLPTAFTPPDYKYLSIAKGPIHFLGQIRRARKNPTDATIRIDITPVEDSIHPVPLAFPAPLAHLAASAKAFTFHWEKLTYAFALSDPRQFPELTLDPAEKQVVVRFVKTCLTLAGYTVFDGPGGLHLAAPTGPDSWSVGGEFPSHQEFTGLSATFRQLHNPSEEASYSKVKNILDRAIRSHQFLNPEDLDRTRSVSKEWDTARKALLKKMISTIICEKVMIGRGLDPAGRKVSMSGAVPDDIIKIYNYGDLLHWGDQREAFATLTKNEYTEAFHKHCCIDAMLTLSHFYFGYAVLAAAALGMTVGSS